jgi:SAM-dependent methyltransferase
MAEYFSGDWLELREPHDAAARDEMLAVKLSAALPARPRIMDLGAGTGALLRWLGLYIGRPQAWILVDADPQLIERAFDTIAERAEQMGWKVTSPGRGVLLVHTPRGAWRVEGLVADLRDAPANLPLHSVDAVVNTALCDLVSEPWLERMAAACVARKIPFYAALNVTGPARFIPPHRADAWVTRGFLRDQARDKGFGGRALGHAAPAAIARAFTAQGYVVEHSPSPWKIPRAFDLMVGELAMGCAEAALRQERREAWRIEDWADARAAQAEQQRLSASVAHMDVLALPGG